MFVSRLPFLSAALLLVSAFTTASCNRSPTPVQANRGEPEQVAASPGADKRPAPAGEPADIPLPSVAQLEELANRDQKPASEPAGTIQAAPVTAPGAPARPVAPGSPIAKSRPEESNSSSAPKNRQRVGLPQISIIDKLLATEYALGPTLKRTDEESWAELYRNTYRKFHATANPANLAQKRAVLALALGIKATDGVIALKGRDIEGLNDCAVQIEQLAAKLNVPKEYLERANSVRHNARDRRWLEAFMELGILQQQIMKRFESNPEQKDDAMLVIIGSWLQGGRCMTDLLGEYYTKQSSNILREPKMVAAMLEEFSKISPNYQAEPIVKEITEFLPYAQKKVDVGIRDPIPKEDLKALNERFTKLVEMILKPVTP